MNYEDLRQWGSRAGEWAADYYKSLPLRPVRPTTRPGDVLKELPESPPMVGQSIENVFSDFEQLIVPNMTHWQHPRFFAYFPSNTSPPSVVAEWLTSVINAQCMIWQTSPAGTELEIAVLNWLRQMIGLEDRSWQGMIQTGASIATLSFILVARDRALEWRSKEVGLFGQPVLRLYTSKHSHSSIEKAVFLSGIGRENLVYIDTDEANPDSMSATALREKIQEDRAKGMVPCGLITVVGSTSIGASDQLDKVLSVAKEEGLITHVDAAWAGSALICPEIRAKVKGLELADSIVFNPHKWLMTNFDCCVHLVKNAKDFKNTMMITPAYLQTEDTDGVTDQSHMTMELGRRFRALKLWFVIRCYGLEGLQKIVRNHVLWTRQLAEKVRATRGFEITTEPKFGIFTFRIRSEGMPDKGVEVDEINKRLVNDVNADGTLYLTQTTVQGRYIIRVSIGTTMTSEKDIQIAYSKLVSLAANILDSSGRISDSSEERQLIN